MHFDITKNLVKKIFTVKIFLIRLVGSIYKMTLEQIPDQMGKLVDLDTMDESDEKVRLQSDICVFLRSTA